MSHDFTIEGLTITPDITASFTRDGISAPTPVQTAAIPPILAGQDVLVQSGTGTGKTLAYLLPLLQKAAADVAFRVLVIAPTPELAIQILRTVEAYKPKGMGSVGLVGGGNADRQMDKLKKHPQIMVGTPGRVLELIFMRKVKHAKLAAFVLDEADEIMSPHNEVPINELCSRPEFVAQIICASATFGARSQAFADKHMKAERVHTQVSETPLSENIKHISITFPQARRELTLLQTLQKHRIKKALVFVNKLYNVAHLYRFMNEHGVPSLGLSAERTKQDREQAIRSLKSGDTRLLIATDTAARGLDIKDMEWVIHYEVARDAQTYLHRAGRVGRAGRTGNSLVFIAPNEQFLLKRYATALNIRFTRPGENETARPSGSGSGTGG